MLTRSSLTRLGIFCLALALSAHSAHAATLGFTTGLKLWLEADQGVTTVGSTVTDWADQSGNGHDGSYTSGAPQLIPAAINGLAAISFNGNGDYFSLANGQVLSSDSFTVFAVATDTGDSNHADGEIYSNWDGSNSWSSQFLGTWAGTDPNRTARFTDGLAVSDALSTPTTPFVMWGVYSSGVNADLYVDGVLVGSNPQNSLPADVLNPNGQRDITTPSFIGQQGSFQGEFWQGYIGEVLVFDGALSLEDQSTVYNYLNEKWIAVPEPSSLLLVATGLFGLLILRRRRV